jgi:hypothetical protein
MWTNKLPFEARHELESDLAHALPRERRFSDLTADVLRAASRLLDGLAARLDWVAEVPAVEPVLEFHADAGAPEGALYVNGELVGHLTGVSRL